MQTRSIAASLAAVLFMCLPVFAGQPYVEGTMNPDIWGAGACAAPEYGTMGPGCPQCRPKCCEDAWAGYCEEKHHGFAIPCIRPVPRWCSGKHGSNCTANCCNAPSQIPLEENPVLEAAPSAAPEAEPTPAPELPPLPPDPPASQKLKKPEKTAPEKKTESESPSDTTTMPFPVFNPAAWRIGTPVK